MEKLTQRTQIITRQFNLISNILIEIYFKIFIKCELNKYTLYDLKKVAFVKDHVQFDDINSHQ